MDASSSSFDTATATATATVESAAAAVLATERWIVEKKKNQRRNYFTNGHRKVPYCHKIDHLLFVLAQFHPIKTMGQPPCFDIEYWRS